MNTYPTSRLLKLFVVTAGSLATALGLLVVVGWHTHNEVLLHVRPNFVAMVYNAALGFILCGTAIIAISLGRPRWATLGGVLASSIGLLTLVEYRFGVDVGIDQGLMKSYMNVANAYPGRMAVTTAAFFFAAGLAISLLGASRRFRFRPRIVGVLGAACTVQGIVGFAGYFTGVASVYVWGDLARMAIHTALGTALIGASLLTLAWRDQGPRQRSKDSYWLPILVGLVGVTITLCMWQALIVQQRAQSELLVKTEAANLRSEIAGNIRIRVQALHRMAERWEQNGKPSEESWEASARLNLKDFPGLVALCWSDSSRKERWTAQLPGDQFRVDLDTVFDLEHSLPVSFSDQGIARVTPAIDLGQKGRAFYLYVPVFESGRVSGFIIGAQTVQEFVDEATAEVNLGHDYAVAVLDGKTQIYGGDIGGQRSQQTKQKTEVEFPGTTWQIWVWPKATTVSQFGSNVPIATLIVGLLSALMLSGSVRLAQNARRNARRAEQASKALGDLSTLMRTILDSANYTIISADLDGTIRTFNKAAERMLGYSAEEVIGKLSPALFHDPLELEQRAALMSEELGRRIEPGIEVFVEKARIGKQAEDEWTYIRKDGSRLPVMVSVTALHDQGGQLTGYLGIGSDISERKRAEASLRESEEKYRDLFENANDIIYTHDLEGNYTSVNKACEKIGGYTHDESIKMNVSQVIAPEYLTMARNMVALKGTDMAPSVYELEMIHKDGHRVVLEINSRLTYEGTRPTGVQGMARDITERKRAEEALRESEERYRLLFESNPQPMWVYDLETLAFLAVNESAVHHYGYSQEDFLAMTIKDIRPAEDIPALYDSIARGSKGVDVAGRWRHLKKDGTIIEVEITSHLLVFDDRRAELILAHDITERRRAEAERQAITEIVQGVITTSNLDELFTLAHQSISKLLSAENCFVALYDKTSDLLHIPFCKDEFDTVAAPQKLGRGLTAFVLRSGRPMLLTPELIQELVLKGEIELVGTLPAAWLGVPLRTSTDIIGVLVVQHYEDKDAYSQQDLELLASVADQLGLAIERKQIEIELKTNEMQLTAAQQIAHLGSWEWDNVNKKLHWSEELFRIFGLPPREVEVTFKDYFGYIHPDDRKLVMRSIKQVLGGGEFPEFDYRVIRPDGTVRTLQVNCKAIADATGRVTRIWGTTQDITERKRAEKEREVISEVIQSVNLTSNLDELLKQVHQSLKRVLYAENCCVVLYDKQTGLFEAPLFVDLVEANPFPMALSKSFIARVFSSRQPLLMNEAIFRRLLDRGEIELIGRPASVISRRAADDASRNDWGHRGAALRKG